jgi:hypothetical protein
VELGTRKQQCNDRPRSTKGGSDDLSELWALPDELPERPDELPDDLRPHPQSGQSAASERSEACWSRTTICRSCGRRRTGDSEGAAQASDEQKLNAGGGGAILRMGSRGFKS